MIGLVGYPEQTEETVVSAGACDLIKKVRPEGQDFSL